MGLKEEIEDTEAALARLVKELELPAGDRRNTNTVLAEIHKCQRSIATAKRWLSDLGFRIS